MTTEAFAPAKINLSLHVTGQRADGYHLLDSLVVFADVGDRLWFEPAPQMQIEVTGRFADGVPTNQRNLVWQAAELAGWAGHVTLEKNLPHGAGIGGLLIKVGGSIVRALFGGSNTTSPPARYIVCNRRGCGHENRSGASFCAQCGKPL